MLGDLTFVEGEASRQDVAERLSLWLDAFDAIKLHAAQQPIKTTAAEERPPDARPAMTRAVEAEFHRVRTALVKAMTANDGSRAHEADAGYAPYRQRYLDRQRHMELTIGPLRAQVRQALSRASPQLGQLATLDAVLDQTLGGREQKLLSTVPVLLERRFEHLRKTHQLGLDPAQQDDPALWAQAGGWLDDFGKEMQAVLLAELEVRLQPVEGLMEAFSNELETYA